MYRYCARLIHGWGGKLGTLKGTDEGKRLMSEMKKVKIDDARALITKLISKGYDKSIPVRRSDQDILVSFDASAKLVMTLKDCKISLSEACIGVDSAIENLMCLVECFRSNLEPFVVSVSSKGQDLAENEFQGLYHNLQTEADDSDETLFNEYGCIDSDEEAQLYRELDCLMEAQERAMAFKGDSKKFMANAFQKLFMRIEEMGTAFESVSHNYGKINSILPLKFDVILDLQICKSFQTRSDWNRLPTINLPEELQQPMSLLSIQLTQYELEDIFEDGSNCAQTCSHILTSYEDDHDNTGGVTLTALLAGSKKLRTYLSNLKTDPIFCSLMDSEITNFASMAQIRLFAEVGKVVEVERIGSMVYDSKTCKKGMWYVVISGKLKVSRYGDDETDDDYIPQHELSSGEIFGGFGLNNDTKDVVHIKIETLQPSKYLEMSETVLTDLENEHSEVFGQLMSRMAGDCLE